MNLVRHKLSLLILMFSCLLAPLWGQADYHLNFQGLLTDIEGKRISNEQFDLKVQLKQRSDQSVIFEFASAVSSDEEGWFKFQIENISAHLINDGTPGSPLVLFLEFLPNEQTKWIGENEDFMVSYTLSPNLKENRLEIVIKRLEGSLLTAHSEEHFSVFKDQIPFAYLTGGFLIADHHPADKQLVDDLKIWISPSKEDEAEARSRGVKGGFPTGGYHRKKK